MAECSVCLDDVDSTSAECVTLPCNHVFHSQCIQDWRNQQPAQQEVTCPNCRHGVQQESMQEIMRPFEYLDLVLIPLMFTIWICQGAFITLPLKMVNKMQGWTQILYNIPFRNIIPYLIGNLTYMKERVSLAITTTLVSIWTVYSGALGTVFAIYTSAKTLAMHVSDAIGRTIVYLLDLFIHTPATYIYALLTWVNHLIVTLLWQQFVVRIAQWISLQFMAVYTATITTIADISRALFRIVSENVQAVVRAFQRVLVSVWQGIIHPTYAVIIRYLAATVAFVDYIVVGLLWRTVVLGIWNFAVYYTYVTYAALNHLLVDVVYARVLRVTNFVLQTISTAMATLWRSLVLASLALGNRLKNAAIYCLHVVIIAGIALWEQIDRLNSWTRDVIYLGFIATIQVISAIGDAISTNILLVLTTLRQIITWTLSSIYGVTIRPFVYLVTRITASIHAVYRAFIAWLATESELILWIKQRVSYYVSTYLVFPLLSVVYNFQILTRYIMGICIAVVVEISRWIHPRVIFYYVNQLYIFLCAALVLTERCLEAIYDNLILPLLAFAESLALRAVDFIFHLHLLLAHGAYQLFQIFFRIVLNPLGYVINRTCEAIYFWTYLAVSFCVSCVVTVAVSIYTYSIWMAAVSANALVALAQMGLMWIKVRALKTYHFFKPPFVQMVMLVNTLLTGTWNLVKTQSIAMWAYARLAWTSVKTTAIASFRAAIQPISRAWTMVRNGTQAMIAEIRARYQWTKETTRALIASALAPVRNLIAHAKAQYAWAKARGVEAWRLVKQRTADSWRAASAKWQAVKQEVGAKWRTVTAGIRGRWAETKQLVGIRWRSVKARVLVVKQRFVDVKNRTLQSWALVKERVKATKADTLQQWKLMKERMAIKPRWDNAKLQFNMYKAQMKRRMMEIKERTNATWRRTRAKLVTSRIQS